MIKLLRNLGIVVFLTLKVTSGLGQGDVDWYENLFHARKTLVLEQVLESRKREFGDSQKEKDFARQSTILNELAVLHLTRTFDYGAAMDTLIRALQIEELHGLKGQQIFTFITIAKVFAEANNFEKSRQYLLSALRVVSSSEISTKALIEIDLGKVNMKDGKIDVARENFTAVLDFKDALKKKVYRAQALSNLAMILTAAGKYQPALNNHRQALSIFRSLDDQENEARSLNDIGELYRLMKSFDKSLENHTVAVALRKKLGDRGALAASYNNIGRLYFQKNDLTPAIAYFKDALGESHASQDRLQLSISNEYLSECYERLQNFQEALRYKNDYIAMRELIHGEINEHSSSDTQNQYEINKRQSRIDVLEADRIAKQRALESAALQRRNLLIVFGFTVVIILLVSYLYIDKRRSGKRLQKLNATKDKFFSIISHDLKGPLNSLSSFSNLLINHADQLSKEEIKMLATDFDKSLKNLFALLENLLDWSRSQTGNIDFSPERFDVISLLVENKALLDGQAKLKEIEIRCDAGDSLIVNVHKNSINTVIRNLLSNAIKFTANKGAILITATPLESEVIISVKDNGVGIPPDMIEKLFRIDSKHSTKGTANEKGTGLGLILCKDFVEKNGGRLWVESKEGDGSTFSFTLPYHPDQH